MAKEVDLDLVITLDQAVVDVELDHGTADPLVMDPIPEKGDQGDRGDGTVDDNMDLDQGNGSAQAVEVDKKYPVQYTRQNRVQHSLARPAQCVDSCRPVTMLDQEWIWSCNRLGLEQIYTTELRVPGVTNQPSAAQSNIALEMTAQPEMELDTIDGRTGGRELQGRGRRCVTKEDKEEEGISDDIEKRKNSSVDVMEVEESIKQEDDEDNEEAHEERKEKRGQKRKRRHRERKRRAIGQERSTEEIELEIDIEVISDEAPVLSIK